MTDLKCEENIGDCLIYLIYISLSIKERIMELLMTNASDTRMLPGRKKTGIGNGLFES